MSDMLSYLPQILPAYIAYIIAVLSPGPAVFAIITASIAHGRRSGIAMALGVFAGSLTWACAAALGLAALLKTYALALEILKIAGGLYLLYLAYKAFCAARRADDTAIHNGPSAPVASLKSLFIRGYGIHLTNPKAIFGWLAIISLGMPQGAPSSLIGVIIGSCLTTGFIIFTTYAVVFSTPHALRLYKASRRWIEGGMTVLYGFASFKLLTSRL